MVGSLGRLFLVSLILMIVVAAGQACPWRIGAVEGSKPMPPPTWYYCVPAPMPYANLPSPIPQKSMPKVKNLAEPTPAPPSPSPAPGSPTPVPRLPTTAEPPTIQKRAPTVFEARSGARAAQAPEVSQERCKVGFWNVTGQDVTLTIDGKSRMLAKHRAVTVDIGREFTWQITGREPRHERVPLETNVFEVILRP
jgi:hypothetical protein